MTVLNNFFSENLNILSDGKNYFRIKCHLSQSHQFIRFRQELIVIIGPYFWRASIATWYKLAKKLCLSSCSTFIDFNLLKVLSYAHKYELLSMSQLTSLLIDLIASLSITCVDFKMLSKMFIFQHFFVISSVNAFIILLWSSMWKRKVKKFL